MSSTLKRQTVLITGCSDGGIGHALAKEFHANGLRVIASARRKDTMEKLSALGIETLELDVTKMESIKEVHRQVSEMTGGRLDILVNNAGQSYSEPATDITLDAVKAMFDVNVFGVMAMVQRFAGLLIAAGGDSDPLAGTARIVNIGSIAGVMPYPFGSTYNASKAALHAYGDTLRVEMAPFGVKVLTIVTGGVASNIARHARTIHPDSVYAPIADIHARTRVGRSQRGALSAEVYAQRVVAQTLKTHPRAWYWTGSFAWPCWFLSTFGGRRAFDWLFSWNFGLVALRDILRRKARGRGE